MKSSCLLQGCPAGVDWSDLPRDLIESIFDRLRNPHDLLRFRSVCRSWRLALFSLSPSPFFPRTISIPHEASESRPVTLIASAIYLLRPRRRDPHPPRSSSWLVSVQESAAGSLLLRHALTYQTIALSIDSSEWSATRFAMSYGYNALCGDCSQIERTEKLDLVPDLASGSDPDPEAMALWIDHWKGMYAWRFSLSKKSQTTSASRQEFTALDCEIEDFVKLGARTFYAIDSATCVYVFHCGGDMRMDRLECEAVVDSGSAKSYRKRLVVSEGDLYLVLRFRHDFSHPPECLVYKLTN